MLTMPESAKLKAANKNTKKKIDNISNASVEHLSKYHTDNLKPCDIFKLNLITFHILEYRHRFVRFFRAMII